MLYTKVRVQFYLIYFDFVAFEYHFDLCIIYIFTILSSKADLIFFLPVLFSDSVYVLLFCSHCCVIADEGLYFCDYCETNYPTFESLAHHFKIHQSELDQTQTQTGSRFILFTSI